MRDTYRSEKKKYARIFEKRMRRRKKKILLREGALLPRGG